MTVNDKNAAAELDQFFTRKDVAARCWRDLQKTIARFAHGGEDLFFVEPSAGDGSFYDLLPDGKRLGLDIAPQRKEFKRVDFLQPRRIVKRAGSRVVVVGNPPFGKRGKLAVAFCKRAAEFADTVAFIVPVIFQKFFIHKQMPEGWRLVLSNRLDKDAFYTPDGKIFGAQCVFQVWTKCDMRGGGDLRVFAPPPISHKDFQMWQYNNTTGALKMFKNKFDFAVPSQGWQDYGRREYKARDCEKTKQWMLFSGNDKTVVERLHDEMDYAALAIKNTTSIPGFRKGDIVAEYGRLYDSAEDSAFSCLARAA